MDSKAGKVAEDSVSFKTQQQKLPKLKYKQRKIMKKIKIPKTLGASLKSYHTNIQ